MTTPARDPVRSQTESAAAAHAPRLLIRASAGTGKTYQLSTRYISQLAGSAPERILATTFTRKAAGEILERILLRLAEAALDDRQRSALSSGVGRDVSRAVALALLTGLVRNLHRVRVATLDSFFSRIAGAFALELGLPAGWRLLDEIEDSELRTRAIESVLREGDRHDLVQMMHLLSKGDAQRSVTGLVRETVNDLYAVYLETTADAWRAIDGPHPLTAVALNEAIAELRTASLPNDKNWLKAVTNDIAALEAEDWDAFISKGLGNRILDGETTYYRKPIDDSLRRIYDRLLKHVGAIECRTLSGQLSAARDLLGRFDAVYRQLKRDAGGLTFDDVARRLAEEFSQHDPSGLAFRLDAQLEHLLLDEFQDTSLVQWTVLEPLAKGVAHGEGTTFFCVGDVKQAIYGWRGGVAEIFQTVTSRIAGVTERQLDVSFRSSPPVIETVNKVFEKCESFPALDDHEATFVEWARAFPPHATHRNESGYACLVVGPEPAAGENAKEAVYTGAAAHLAELLPKLPPQTTIGVLARKNEAVGAIVRELRKHGLPASQEGGNPLTDSAAVQLIVSAMQLADHPGDTISRFHVAQSPIGPLLDLPREPNDDQATAAAEQIRRSLQMRGYGGVVDDWIEALTDHCHARELDRLRQLAVLSDEYDPRGTLRPADFVRFVKARGVEDPRAARIRVMTVHKAKGLEFDVVLLPQLDEDLVRPPKFVAYREQGAEAAVRICRYRNKSVQRLLPPEIQAAFRQTADRAMRESLCVFYVALTRAAQALYMFVPAGSKSTKSYAGILRSTLAPSATTTAGSVLYECGDPQWHVGSPLAAPAVKAATVTPTRFTPPAGVRRRGRESQAPSQLKGGRRLSIRDVLRSADDRAVQRGRLLHAWFEQLKWIDDALPTDDDLRRSARRLECTDELVAECAREFQSLLAADGLSRILCQAAYRESLGDLFGPDFRAGDDLEIVIEQERRFDVVLDDELVSGSIDRLVLLKRGGKVVAADILDFKSDAIYGDRQTAVAWLVEAYAGQLQCYARAVAQLHQLPQEAIRTRLVLLATPEVVTVET